MFTNMENENCSGILTKDLQNNFTFIIKYTVESDVLYNKQIAIAN